MSSSGKLGSYQRMQKAGAWLNLQVRRGPHLVNDTMLQLQNAASQGTLKQPLRVKFAGEEGVDEGGVSKVCIRRIS